MKRCYFCGSRYFNEKIKFKGKENGKKRQKTTYICITCSAMSDERMIEEELGWDEGSLEYEVDWSKYNGIGGK